MQLSQLLTGLISLPVGMDFMVKGLTQDSRHLKPGEIFCAVAGAQTHGGYFIPQVIAQQPAAILLDVTFELAEATLGTLRAANIPVVRIPNLNANLGFIASRFFGSPSKELSLIAVTGTNGKTSICHYLAQALTYLQKSCGILGTAGIGFINQLRPSPLTTLDPIRLQYELAQFVRGKAQQVALEASSHALVQQRLSGCQITTAVFTNLTPEHLDYHCTMEAYEAAKALLMQWPELQQAVVNVDDPVGLRWCQRYHTDYPMVAYSCAARPPIVPNGVPLLSGNLCEVSPQGLRVQISSPWGAGEVQIPLIGQFNIANALAVLGVLQFYHPDFMNCLQALSTLRGVCGRMQVFTQANFPTIVVDYAHTPDALENALQSLRTHQYSHIWCVFGCGGDRDRLKRPLMGQIVATYADYIILTNDNPRHEAPQQIMADIQQGFSQDDTTVHVEMNRATAIQYAISQASSDDVVLIAGKGHETYQQLGEERVPFSDQAVVMACLNQQE